MPDQRVVRRQEQTVMVPVAEGAVEVQQSEQAGYLGPTTG